MFNWSKAHPVWASIIGCTVILLALLSVPKPHTAGLIVLFYMAWFALYWLPTIIALWRKVPNKGSVAVINGFLGWTAIGWIVALAMAVRSRAVPVVAHEPFPVVPHTPRHAAPEAQPAREQVTDL
jgi:Superinfection immunity protein